MEIIRKSFVIINLVILFYAPEGVAGTRLQKAKHGLQYDGTLAVQGISGEVTVFRDERGMPHIYALNEHDLYLVTGYISAQERLWQMDLIRRSSTGHLSEIFGKSFIQTDLLMRSLRIEAQSKIIIQNQDPDVLECLKAYVDGVNEYISSGCTKLPVEFRILSYKPDPWRLEDIACIIGFMGWNLGSRLAQTELFNYLLLNKLGIDKGQRIIPDWKISREVVYPGFRLEKEILAQTVSFLNSFEKIESLGIVPVAGSNNWAVSGKKTVTGNPMLANDMHLPLGAPGIWFQMHQIVPGKINVTGVMIPGQPFIIAGHNEKIAWGMTNLEVDNIDLYAEKINPDDPSQYSVNGEWRKMDVNEEIVNVRGRKADTFSLWFTHRGPILSGFYDINDLSLSMKWSGFDVSDEVKAVYLLNRASGWTDFRQAISTFRTISQNFVYADVDGNVGLSAAGGIPVRKANGNLIRNGETDEFDWKGYVPYDQLPYSLNPDNGHVSSANNKTVDENYPYYIGHDFFLPYRLNRIRNMLNEKEIFGIEDFKNMITDQHSELAALVTPYILRLNRRAGELSLMEQNALSLFSEWDYEMSPDLIAPTLFDFFRMNLKKNLLEDELGDLFDRMDYTSGEYYIYRMFTYGPDDWVDNINTGVEETLDEIVLQSFRDCVSLISKKYGSRTEKWKWGNIHKIMIEHPLGSVGILNTIFHFNSETFSIGGSDHTVCPFFNRSPEMKVLYGASERHIFNTGNWDDSYTVIPTGESGVPDSEFYLSQTKAYMNGDFYKDAFSNDMVKNSAVHTLRLIPGTF